MQQQQPPSSGYGQPGGGAPHGGAAPHGGYHQQNRHGGYQQPGGYAGAYNQGAPGCPPGVDPTVYNWFAVSKCNCNLT